MLDESLSRLLDDPDFWEIQRRATRFNLFEAIGAVSGELRHSNFLAYLLSPSRPHGLGAHPLQLLLRSVLEGMATADRPLSTLELLVGDLDGAVVHRERDSIDLLIELDELNLVVVIENKIGAKASKGQLQRYRELVETRYPSQRKLFIFLTPDGHAPDDEAYCALSYVTLAAEFDRMLSVVRAGDATQLIVRHYVEMLRKHIVQDEQLKSLAAKLYERHAEALDFIFTHKPRTASLLGVVADLVADCEGLLIDSRGANILRFVPEQWEHELTYRTDERLWTKTGRGLLFELKTHTQRPGRLSISLVLGPGDERYRKTFYSAAQGQPDLFVGLVKPMGQTWSTVFGRDLLSAEAASTMSADAQVANLRFAWSDFQSTTLPKLIETVLEMDTRIGNQLT